MSYRVRAKEMVFDGVRRHRAGQEFYIDELIAFDPPSMEFVDEKDQKEFDSKYEEILEERKEAVEKLNDPRAVSPVGKFKDDGDEEASVPGAPPKAKKSGAKAKSGKSDSGKHNVI